MTEAWVVVALALRACTGPLCCWEVRLDDGRVYRDEQAAEASFEIPRRGSYFEARAAAGPCSGPGVWSDWTRFAWLHPTDLDGDGVVGAADLGLSAASREFGRELGPSDYSYCLPAEPADP